MEMNRRRLLLIVAAVLVLVAVVYGFWPDPTPVQTASVEREALQVIVEEEGETRVRDRYTVSAPVAAFARRVDVEVGDAVEAGDPLVQLEAPRAGLLDARTRAEAQAAIEQAERQVDAAEAAAERAREERQRVEQLVDQGSATRQALEQAIAEERRATADRAAARAAVAHARATLDAAPMETSPPTTLRAPAAGRVLAVHRRSEGAVSPGEPLIEVGDTKAMEVRVDVLSQDAVRIEPGTRVELDQWGGEEPLEAVVDRIEPQGRTSVSALGVEEQRVTVVATLVSPPEQWAGLGSGYRVLTRFIVWEDDDVLQVPTSALFRTDDGWAVFVAEDGVATRRRVDVGQQSGLTAQVTSGLEEGETVIVHPGNELEDDTRVTRQGA